MMLPETVQVLSLPGADALVTVPEIMTVSDSIRTSGSFMGLLDQANTETYGTPAPTEVSLDIEKGPFIVITGHAGVGAAEAERIA